MRNAPLYQCAPRCCYLGFRMAKQRKSTLARGPLARHLGCGKGAGLQEKSPDSRVQTRL